MRLTQRLGVIGRLRTSVDPTAAAVLAVAALAQPITAQCDTRLVAGSSVYYCVTGSGTPTIVLAAGAGSSSATWASLTPRLSGLGTVVVFDRPGLGRSPRGAMPRSPQQISDELAELLEVASPPFVFVGHSMGGHHVLGAALQRLDDAAAVILLDVPHPDFEEMRLTLLSPAERQQRRRTLLEGLSRAPQVVADERAGATAQPPTLVVGSLRDIPLTVVVADAQDFGPLGDAAAHRDLWLSASDDFIALSTAGRRVIARGSGHMIHLEQPALVLDLIRAAIAAQR